MRAEYQWQFKNWDKNQEFCELGFNMLRVLLGLSKNYNCILFLPYNFILKQNQK